MAISNTPDTGFIGKILMDKVQETVEKEVEVIFEEKKQEMIAEMEKRKNEVVAGIVIGLMKHVSMDVYKDQITLTIKEINRPSA